MKLSKTAIAIIYVVSFLFTACSTVLITGRTQLELIPDDTMLSMSKEQYSTFLKSHKLSKNKKQTQLVKRVGRKIQKAVEQYLTDSNLAHEINYYEWEFNLIESKEVNAWATS